MIKALKGMMDRYGTDMKKHEYILKVAKEVFEKYGYSRIITPTLEETELFRRGVGGETDIVSKEMYDFKDKADRDVTMRPEGTAGVVRAYLEGGFHKADPVVKWYYSGPMYRYEAPQKGRYREFYQVGVEMFGIRNPFLDAEMIKMSCEFLEKLGIRDLVVELNSLGNIQSRMKYIEELKKFMYERLDRLSEDSKRRYEKNPLRALDSKDEGDQREFEHAPKLSEYFDDESREYFEQTKKYLDAFNINYVVNEKLVRGLDYYSDTVFEIKTTKLGSQGTVLGGGRYDKLLEIIGNAKIPGIGFAAGIERVSMLMDEDLIKEDKNKIFVAYFEETKDYFIEILQKLREYDIAVDFDYNAKSFGAQMKKANKLGADYVVILGEEEKNEDLITLKDFSTGNQAKYSFDELLEKLGK